MPVELEAKMRVGDLDAVRTRLRMLGVKLEKQIDELNTFLDTPDHTLLKNDEGLRIRRNRDRRTNRDEIVITFKGKRGSSTFKSREELELTVESYDDALALFTRLGYRETLTFEKHREIYECEDCEICLDRFDEIGDFVEIEGPDEATIARMREKLNLQDAPLIKESYAALLAAQRQNNPPSHRSA